MERKSSSFTITHDFNTRFSNVSKGLVNKPFLNFKVKCYNYILQQFKGVLAKNEYNINYIYTNASKNNRRLLVVISE